MQPEYEYYLCEVVHDLGFTTLTKPFVLRVRPGLTLGEVEKLAEKLAGGIVPNIRRIVFLNDDPVTAFGL